MEFYGYGFIPGLLNSKWIKSLLKLCVLFFLCFVIDFDFKLFDVSLCSCRQTVCWISGVTAVPWNWAAGVWYSSWFYPNLFWQIGSTERHGEEGFPEGCTIITCKSCDKYCYFVFHVFTFFAIIQKWNIVSCDYTSYLWMERKLKTQQIY